MRSGLLRFTFTRRTKGMNRHLLGMGLVAWPLALMAADGELLNGDFEKVDDTGCVADWTYESAYYTVDRAGGRNGTCGLLFDNRGDNCGSPILQRVRVRPGVKYAFGAWFKPDHLDGKGYGGRICILWEDQYGQSLEGYYVSGHIRGTSDWKLSEGTTTKAPANAMWATVRPEIVAPIKGRAWVDDVFFAPIKTEPVLGLYTSAYRNEVADGSVTLAAALSAVANPKATWKTCRAVYSWTDAEGKARSVEADSVTEDSALLLVPASAFGMGETKVAFSLIGKTDGVEYGRSETKVCRVREARSRRVAFDRRGRTLVDGKPFFPLGMYWSVAKSYHSYKLPNLNATSIVTFADSPFNCTMPYAGLSKEQLDLCQKYGIMAIYPLLSDFSKGDWDPTGVDKSRAFPADAVRHIANYKDHPALLAWYVNDERNVREIVNLRGRQRVVEALDPDHPTWVCLYQYDQIAEYMGSFDCVGTDPYPVGRPIREAYDWAAATRRGTMGVRPMWQVPQAFDWATFHQQPGPTDRMPTREEMKSMTWQAIVGGANGLIYYSYTYLMASPTTPFEKAWGDVRATAQEVRDCFDVLLGEGEPPKVVSTNAAVPIRTWRNGAKRYVLAVNPDDKPVKTRIDVDEAVSDVKVRVGAANYRVQGGKIGLGLEPCGYVMFEF